MKSYDEIINKNRAPYWESLERELGVETVDALKEMYTLYTSEMIDWFASLYDVEIGGYYYSESARDNEGFLPDAESTVQALGFWRDSGLCAEVGGYAQGVPEWIGEDICRFISSLQDPDGYFYHPQWGKDITLSRRGRDLNWSRNILSAFGRSPKYPTIIDKKSDAEQTETLIPEHLSSAEKFNEYLISLNLGEFSYHKGSELSSQLSQIKACGLEKQLIEFLNGLQHPDTGLWHNEKNYYGVNGLMKLSGIYLSSGLPLPNAMNAAMSAADAIVSDEPVTSIVSLWNTWVALSRVCSVLRSQGGEVGNEQADAILSVMRKRAAECIRVSYKKLLPFRKSGSSFSYNPKKSAPFFQGAPAAVKDTPEGDVNATVIGSSLMLNSIYSALGVPSELRVPMFFEEDRIRYVDLLNKKRENAKFDN